MKQILCIADTPWHGLPSRTMQLMSRLKNFRVLYIDPSPAASSRTEPSHRGWRDEGEHVTKNVTVLTAPPRGRAADTSRFFNKTYYKRMAGWLKKQMREYGFERPLLWLTAPSALALRGRLDHGAVVFDCSEPFSESLDKAEHLRYQWTRELTAEASLILTQSESLSRLLSGLSSHVVTVSNGVDYELFQRATDGSLPFPNDLFTIKNPILGHIGAVNEHLNLSYVEAAAKAHPDWSFVFVGEVSPNTDVEPLSALGNVRFLGVKPQKQLPAYLCRFDVCISLYKAGELSRDISPMKLYEYLATGKPIVSTPQPSQVLDFAEVVYISGTAEEWTESCRRALSEHDAWKVRQRGVFAQVSGWETRVAEVEHAILEKGVLEL